MIQIWWVILILSIFFGIIRLLLFESGTNEPLTDSIFLFAEICTQVRFARWQGKAEGPENSFNTFRYQIIVHLFFFLLIILWYLDFWFGNAQIWRMSQNFKIRWRRVTVNLMGDATSKMIVTWHWSRDHMVIIFTSFI